MIAENRDTAAFYCVSNGATVFVKDGDFFREQGGLKDPWGKNWIGINTDTLGNARRYAAANIFGIELSFIYKNEK